VPTAAWSYDYGQKIATINVTSMLAKAATISMGYGNAVGSVTGIPDSSSPFYLRTGTITDIGTDGTVTVKDYSGFVGWPWHTGANCWTEGDTIGTIDTSIYAPAKIAGGVNWDAPSSGTITTTITFVGGTKDWMVVGRTLVETVPWPSGIYINQSLGTNDAYNVQQFFNTAGSQLGLTWDADNWTKFKNDLQIIPLAWSPYYGSTVVTASPASLGAVPLYFGGQLWVDTMNDLMTSVGANWTVDGLGKIRARLKRASALESVGGTIDFNDAMRYINERWTFNESEGLSLVSIFQNWDSIDQDFNGTAQTEGSSNTGAVLSQNAKWQRDLGGKLLADRIMTWEKPISRLFSLPFPKEDWGSLVPGTLINLINIPTAIQPNYGTGVAPLIAQGKYLITARHYDYTNEIAIADFRQSPPLTGVFILDHSELDGPDKLY